MIIKDGYLPTPSPDGEWIAFFGSESTDKPLPLRIGWERDPQGAALVVARIDGSGRVALNEQGGTYPPIVWLNDNSHFLTLNQVKESPNAQTDILMWDITTQRFSNVGSLQAKDFKEINRSIVEPQFLPLRLSADGKKLIVFVTEYVSKDPITKYLVTRGSLESVDLSRGAISLIFQTNDDFGIDWRD